MYLSYHTCQGKPDKFTSKNTRYSDFAFMSIVLFYLLILADTKLTLLIYCSVFLWLI